MQAGNNGWQIAEGRSYLPDCIQVFLPKGRHGCRKGKGIGSDCWECGCKCPRKDCVAYPDTRHAPLGIKTPSLATDTELGMCLRLFLSKLSQLCSDKSGKTNCALLWEAKKKKIWIVANLRDSPNCVYWLGVNMWGGNVDPDIRWGESWNFILVEV